MPPAPWWDRLGWSPTEPPSAGCATCSWSPSIAAKGLGRALVQAAVEHPDLRDLKRYMLATADGHGLYADYGFEVIDRPERWMIKRGDTA